MWVCLRDCRMMVIFVARYLNHSGSPSPMALPPKVTNLVQLTEYKTSGSKKSPVVRGLQGNQNIKTKTYQP